MGDYFDAKTALRSFMANGEGWSMAQIRSEFDAREIDVDEGVDALYDMADEGEIIEDDWRFYLSAADHAD